MTAIWVINPNTIKLCLTQAQATQSLQQFAVSAVNASTGTITLANNGFTNNEAVTYRGPTAAHFLGTQVNTSNSTLVIGPSQTGDAFQTNDRVTYTVSPASPGFGIEQPEHRLVTAVDTVEVANGQGAGRSHPRMPKTPENLHRSVSF